MGSRFKDLGAEEVDGHMLATRIRQNGRNVSWSLAAYQISPDFRTEVGFVRRRDIPTVTSEFGYRFWPESWIISWGPTIDYGQNYNYDELLQDENLGLGINFNFARNIRFSYRVDAGTVFFVGYDDHFQQADLIEGDRDGDGLEEQLFFTTGHRRTNRAMFVKLQYLLRY